MCAIFGIIGNYDAKKARYALGKLTHRGPNYCGIEERKNLFFAHNRLAIVDLDPKAHQPLRHGNDIFVSFNGEIYNHKALRQELDYNFQTNGDAEVILALYLRYGKDFIHRLRGMFAIAIYDKGKLLLYRDRLGKKPLFYLQTKEAFYFASEIKALVPFLERVRLNQKALDSYLSYLAPTQPHTFFEGVRKLAPAQMLEFENTNITLTNYFDLLDVAPNMITDKNEAITALETKLQESIALRLESDVEMASLLSGGIDSATLNYYAKKLGKKLTTYTLGFEDFTKYDERENAKESAKLLGLENISIELSKQNYIDSIDAVFETLDEPLNDPAAIPLYHLMRRIKQDGYTVVLSGEGNDELFLGYRQYFEYLQMEQAKKVFHKNWLKKYFRSHFSMNREWEWYKRAFEDEVIFRCSSEKFTDMQKNLLFRKNVRDGESFTFIADERKRFEASRHTDESIWFSYIDLLLFQGEHFLAKLDRVSMAHSIESRTPFLDHEFVSLVFAIDPRLRYETGETKALFKEMMQEKLPPQILKRKKKGFSNPYGEYLYESGRVALIEKVNEQTGMFHKDVLARYVQTAKKGRFKQHVWGLYALSWWIKRWML